MGSGASLAQAAPDRWQRSPWARCFEDGDTLTATSATASPRIFSRGLWLISPGYDLAFIIFSSALLVVPHLFAQIGGLSNVIVDLLVTALIGGPHPFASHTQTFMETHLREGHRRYTWGGFFFAV